MSLLAKARDLLRNKMPINSFPGEPAGANEINGLAHSYLYTSYISLENREGREGEGWSERERE